MPVLSKLRGYLKLMIWKVAVFLYRAPVVGWLLARLPLSIKHYLKARLYTTTHGCERQKTRGSGLLPVKPGISIVIPVYNHAEYLGQCIDSALSQTYRNTEVIVVDDASPDARVREILQRYSGRKGLKIIFHEQNKGISEAQNTALAASDGDIIAFLDCDDYLARDAVEKSLRYWKKGTVYSHSARINVDADGHEVNRIAFDHLPRKDYFRENLEGMYATHFKMISAQAIARVGGFDPRFDSAQDYDMLMRIAFHFPSTSFSYVPHFVYHHRLHGGQATEVMNERQSAGTETVKSEARLRRALRSGKFDHRISIIMLSFGKHQQTIEAIRSIEETVAVPHEIVLFDNGSDAATVDFIREHIDGVFENVRVIYNPENLGPAAGRRRALEYARGDWVLVFDNDEIAQPGWIEEMIVRACSRPGVGSVSAKVIFPNGRCQFTGGHVDELGDGVIDLGLHDREKDAYSLDTVAFRDCDWNPIGATLFLVNPLKWLHPGYPNVFEDAAVSFALRRNGYVLLNCPSAWVIHDHVMFNDDVDMKDRYLEARYRADDMLTSMASFYHENGLIIRDDYVWRENGLNQRSLGEVRRILEERWVERGLPHVA